MSRFVCGRLKRFRGIWRVDGIGSIRPSKELGTRLTFHFSQIKPQFFDTPFKKDASTGATYPLNGHSSWLRLFTPGSLWENGAKIATAPHQSQEFVIDASRCIYTQANKISTFAPYETLLPTNYLQFGDNHESLTRAKYAFVPVLNQCFPSTNWLIIPTAELFRFYLGNSTRLIMKALTGSTDKLIDMRQTTLVDQKLTVFDRTGTLTHREACCYGRTLTGPAAVETYFGPHKYLSAATLQGLNTQLYIDSKFPFNDRTTLLVAGKRIQLQNTLTGKPEWGVYVSQIRRCNHFYGFYDVEIISMGAVGDGTGSRGHSVGGPPIPPKIDPEDELEINDARADSTRGTAIASNLVYSTDPISRISMKRTNLSKEEFSGLKPRVVDTPQSGYTFENASGGANGSGNQQIDIVDISIKGVSRDVLDFIDMLKQLRIKTAAKGWVITTQECAGQKSRQVGTDVITSFPSMPQQFKWYLIEDIDTGGVARPRYAVWVQIKIGARYLYLVEMELKGKEPGRSSLAVTSKGNFDRPAELTEEKFRDLLTLTAIHNGWPPQHRDWKKEYKATAEDLFNEYSFERIKHLYTISAKEGKKENNSKQKETFLEREQAKAVKETNLSPIPANAKLERTGGKVSPEAWASDVYEKLLEAFPW